MVLQMELSLKPIYNDMPKFGDALSYAEELSFRD